MCLPAATCSLGSPPDDRSSYESDLTQVGLVIVRLSGLTLRPVLAVGLGVLEWHA
jgi:hypothetical protein